MSYFCKITYYLWQKVSIYCVQYVKSLHKMATKYTCVKTSIVSSDKTVCNRMGFVYFSEKLIKRMTVIIMCTSAKYIDFITSER